MTRQLAHRYRPARSASSGAARLPQSGALMQLSAQAEMSPTRQRSATLQSKAKGQSKSTRPVPVLQRAAVIPYDVWKTRSFRTGKKRSTELLQIDEALILYHAAIFKDIGMQKARLDALAQKISTWIDVTNTKYKGKRSQSSRLKDVTKLQTQVKNKKDELDQIPSEHPEFGQRTLFTFDVYNRIRLRVQQLLSVPPRDIDKATSEKMVAGLSQMRSQIRDMDVYTDPVTAIWDACSIMIALGEDRLNVAVAAREKTTRKIASPLPRYQARYKSHFAQAEEQIEAQNKTGHTVASHVLESLHKTKADVTLYTALAGKTEDTDTGADLPEGFSEGMDLAGEAMNALGMQGTGGKGNEGLEDYWKTTIPDSDSDQKKRAKEMAATIMGGLHTPTEDEHGNEITANKRAMDKLSGGADIGASAVMSVNLGAELGRLFAVVSNCNKVLAKNPDDKKARNKRREAIARLTFLSTVGTTEMLGKYLGGAFTVAKGHGQSASSNFFSAANTDVSTDMKLTGDSAGVVINAVNTVGTVVDMFKNIFKRAKPVKNDKKTVGEHAQDTFDSLKDISSAASAVGKSYSAVRKLYEQIAAGGQIASENVGSVTSVVRGTVNNVPVIPVLGLIKGCMDFVSEGIKLAKTGRAAHKAKAIGKEMISSGTESLYLAFMLTRDKFIKQIKRAIVDLIHAAASITSGALNVSGLGAGIGAAIGMVSSAAKLIQIGARKFKQYRRDKAAGKSTNLEKAALAKDGDEFVNFALVRTQNKITGKKTKGRFNKDKSTANKEFRYNFAAMEIMQAPETDRQWFFDALNIRRDAQRIENNDDPDFNKQQAIQALIINSLKER